MGVQLPQLDSSLAQPLLPMPPPASRKISAADIPEKMFRHSQTQSADIEAGGKKVSTAVQSATNQNTNNSNNNPNNNNMNSSVSAIGSQRSGITGTRRPSVWTTLMGSAAGPPKPEPKMDATTASANLSGASLLSTGVGGISPTPTAGQVVVADGNVAGPNMADTTHIRIQNLSSQLEVITDGLRSMEKFMRQEAKTSRERIKRLEDLVENELKQTEANEGRLKEDLNRLNHELSRLVGFLEPSMVSGGGAQSVRSSVAYASAGSHLSPLYGK
ncbi:hypothetical protein BDR26DRAFT_876953 [Obelidium mucronatum]|nr:hypothetical protein BDR26DRAFT_876953 [Obelidium mucronatum]